MDLSWQCEKEMASSQRKVPAMFGKKQARIFNNRKQAGIFNILVFSLLLAFLPLSTARQRGSSPVASASFGSSPGCTSEPSLRILKYLDR